MSAETKEKDRAREQAIAQFDDIRSMVERLNHCQGCDDAECDLTDKEIYDGLNLYYDEGDVATEQEREDYHDQDAVLELIHEDPLSVEVRNSWHTPGEDSEADEYMILLCTGGPAVRIVGDLNNSMPTRARLEYQDWFTGWTELILKSYEYAILLTYAEQFYYGN